jgi:hypothetical protein
MPDSSSEPENLLCAAPANLPLTQAALRRVVTPPPKDAARLFPNARYGQAALAGLLLRLGYWAESHGIAQDINSAEGSYWHGIVHRIEPDSFNSAYWFRHVGTHAIFPELQRRAADIIENGAPKHWRLKTTWDPFLFIDWCEEARQKGGLAETTAVEVQMAEWQLLFDYCSASG